MQLIPRHISIAIYLLLSGVVAWAQDDVSIILSDVKVELNQEVGMVVSLDCPSLNCGALDLILEYDFHSVGVQAISWGDFLTNHPEILPLHLSHDPSSGTIRLMFLTLGDPAMKDNLAQLLTIQLELQAEGDSQMRVRSVIAGDIEGVAIQQIHATGGMISLQIPEIVDLLICSSDLNHNGMIDHSDLDIVLQTINGHSNAYADVNHDGIINILDGIIVGNRVGSDVNGCS